MLHENYRRFFDALPMDAHPMPTCAAAIGALSTFYQGDLARGRREDPRHPPAREDADPGRVLVQALDRAAAGLPAERPRLFRELPAHDVLDPVRGVPDRPGQVRALERL
jgi:citrate synthase